MKKAWGIRHLRYWFLRYRLRQWIEECLRNDVGLFVHPADLEYLNAVWRGER